jgi:hypothetical protein
LCEKEEWSKLGTTAAQVCDQSFLGGLVEPLFQLEIREVEEQAHVNRLPNRTELLHKSVIEAREVFVVQRLHGRIGKHDVQATIGSLCDSRRSVMISLKIEKSRST